MTISFQYVSPECVTNICFDPIGKAPQLEPRLRKKEGVNQRARIKKCTPLQGKALRNLEIKKAHLAVRDRNHQVKKVIIHS